MAEAMELCLRFEEGDDESLHATLRVTLPKRWVKSERCGKVRGMFADSYNAKHPEHPLPQCATLWSDRSRRLIENEALIGEALRGEETVWVRVSERDAKEAYFAAKPRSRGAAALLLLAAPGDSPDGRGPEATLAAVCGEEALTEYVPRVLVTKEAPSLDAMRVENQRLLVARASRVLDLFAIPSDDCAVAEVRRTAYDNGGLDGCEEVLTVRLQGRGCFELATLREARDEGKYACAIGRVWNQLAGVLPEEVVAGGYVPLKRECGRLVGEAHGRRWVVRPFFDGADLADPSKLGWVLGLLHKAAWRSRAHAEASAMMELPPRAYEERVREETDWCALTFASAVAAEYERGHRESSLSKSSLTKLETLVAKHAAVTGSSEYVELLNGSATVASWTHGGFRSRSCRVHAATRRIRVDGLEQGRQHTRLDDLYHFFVWDDSRAGILAGRAALPAALRAYVRASEWPFSVAECRLLPTALWLRACRALAHALDDIASLERKDPPTFVFKARKARVEAASFRGPNPPKFATEAARLKTLRARRKVALLALAAIEQSAEEIAQAAREANPRLLSAGPADTDHPIRLLKAGPDDERGRCVPCDPSAARASDSVCKTATRASELGFWGAWAQLAEVNKDAVGAFTPARATAVTSAAFVDVLEGRLAQGRELVEQYDLSKGPTAGTAKTKLLSPAAESGALSLGRRVAAVVIVLERDARRVAHVAEHVRKMLPGCVRLRAVDGMVEGELEGHCERHASEPRIDARGWAKRAACDGLSGAALTASRGELARSASHCAAWRSALDSAAPHTVVLEDDAEIPPGFHEDVARIIAELPTDYDLCHLHVPACFFRDDEAVRLWWAPLDEVVAPMTSLEATRLEKTSVNACYATWSTTAYLVSTAGAGHLLELAQSGIVAPLGQAVSNAALEGRLKAFTPRKRELVASRGALALKTKRETADSFLPSNVTTTPTWHDPLNDDKGQDGLDSRE